MSRVEVASSQVVRRIAALSMALTLCLPLAAACTASAQGPVAAAANTASRPSPTITAQPIARTPHTARPGQLVGQRQLLGNRVFINRQHGFALAGIGQAQYPAASNDGGKTWRVSGPALHLDAAQAPLVVEQVGALSQRVYFAFGGEAVDTTNDGGSRWWRAFLGGSVEAVVPSAGRLLAFVLAPGGSPSTLVYASSDGGRHWHYQSHL
jgi:hypothetical protein